MRGFAIASWSRARRALPEGDARVAAMVDLMWTAFGAREFKAVLELWMAAANQPDVSWAVWPEARAFDAGNPATRPSGSFRSSPSGFAGLPRST